MGGAVEGVKTILCTVSVTCLHIHSGYPTVSWQVKCTICFLYSFLYSYSSKICQVHTFTRADCIHVLVLSSSNSDLFNRDTELTFVFSHTVTAPV